MLAVRLRELESAVSVEGRLFDLEMSLERLRVERIAALESKLAEVEKRLTTDIVSLATFVGQLPARPEAPESEERKRRCVTCDHTVGYHEIRPSGECAHVHCTCPHFDAPVRAGGEAKDREARAEPRLTAWRCELPHKTREVWIVVDADLEIADLVVYLNTISGVRTLSSCQGTVGEGGAHPYRAQVMVMWEDDDTLARLKKEFDVTILGERFGYVHPVVGAEPRAWTLQRSGNEMVAAFGPWLKEGERAEVIEATPQANAEARRWTLNCMEDTGEIIVIVQGTQDLDLGTWAEVIEATPAVKAALRNAAQDRATVERLEAAIQRVRDQFSGCAGSLIRQDQFERALSGDDKGR